MRGLGRRERDTAWWLRAYAATTGAALVAFGGAYLLYLPNPGPAGGLFQISVGALFVYAGLGQRDPVVSRRFVGGMGVLLLLGVGMAVCARLLLGGGGGSFGPVQWTCLVVGIASVLVARRAEPGVLLEAVSAFGAPVAARIVRGRRYRRRHEAVTTVKPLAEEDEQMAGAILVVEDDVVEHALAREGLRTRAVGSGEEALEALRTAAFDLVVLDLGLPGIDGAQACREIRAGGAGERNRDVPVLVLTVRDADTDAVACLEAGADDYLAKPFGPKDLVGRVKAHLGSRRRL